MDKVGKHKASELRDELRGLRKGTGLTLAKLRNCPALLADLATTDANAAYELLSQRLAELGDGLPARALRNAYAVGMIDAQLLTKRRGDFATESKRHKDTVEAYENDAIDELVLRIRAAKALPKGYPKPLEVRLTAYVHERKVTMAKETMLPQPLRTAPQEHFNRSPNFTLPAVMYQVPTDVRPRALLIYVHFMDPDDLPAQLYTATHSSLLAISAGHGRQPRGLQERSGNHVVRYRVRFPKHDHYYCVYWSYEPSDTSA